MESMETSQSQGADSNNLDRWFTAVVERQYNFIIAELPTFKCSKNTRGNTALIEAILLTDEPAVQILAAHEFGCKNDDGKTALEVAYEVNFVGACDILARFEMETLHACGIFLCHRAVSDGNLPMVRSLSPFAINVIQPVTNQTALDLAIHLSSADAIIEELVNTPAISLETLDQACKTANDTRKAHGDRSILELLLIFRNTKEANACQRCGFLRKQLIYLSSQFHKLYSNFNNSSKDAPLKSSNNSRSSSIEEDLVEQQRRPQRHRGKGLNAKLSNQVSYDAQEHSTLDGSERGDDLSFSLTRGFEKLRSMLPNASFDLNIDDKVLTELLHLSRTMRREISALREDIAHKNETIAQLHRELGAIKTESCVDGKDDEDIEIILRPRSGHNCTYSGETRGVTPKDIIDTLESRSLKKSGENANSSVIESNDKLLEEAIAAIKAKDLYINSLLDENEKLKKGNAELDTTSYQEMITSQQEQITHLIDLLYQSKAALEKMSEVEVRCSTLEDDNSLLRQRIQCLEQVPQPSVHQVSVIHKGVSAIESSPSSRHTNSLINPAAERIQHLEATIRSLCTELDHQKLRAREFESDMQTLTAARSHAEMLKEKVLCQQDEIKRLNEVIGVQQNYLELKEIELTKMTRSLEELALNTEKNTEGKGHSGCESSTDPNYASEYEDLKATALSNSPSVPRRLLRRANSSRPATSSAGESKHKHEESIHVAVDGPTRSGRALSASVGHRQTNSDMTLYNLESTPTPIQRLHKQETSNELVKGMVHSLMQNSPNVKIQPPGNQNSLLPTPPSANHPKPPTLVRGAPELQRSSLQTPRQRKISNKQQVAAIAASSAASIIAARQALGMSTPATIVTDVVRPPSQGVSRSAGSINRGGLTKLMSAAIRGDLVTAKAYLKQDAGLQDVEGRSALFYAALHNHPSIVRELVSREALLSTNRKYKDGAGVTALMIAAQEGYKECIKLLYRAEKDCRTTKGKGCIDFAKNDLIVRFIQGLAIKQKY
ncbi:Protein 21.1 [Giardia lamblia P15]|uniref:Protein 21.1 n=1 Tax=Giardia intestinalis (strain P15) TaxID=658858 RepID=E1F5L5_GIAIA|nr:Protein 21.1 [Giardia lamblia P15]